MGGARRSTKERQPKELGLAFGLTLMWGAIAFLSFFPRRSANLMPFFVATLFLIVVWVVAIALLRLRLARNKTIDELRSLSPTEFEDWVAARFRELGYRVRLTGMGGDHGADLVLEKPGELAIVQCKRYRARSAGEPMLRDLYGAMHDFGAQRGYFVTTGYFTDAARDWARGKPLALWDGDDLTSLAQAGSPAQPAPQPAQPQRVRPATLAAAAPGTTATPSQSPRDGATVGGHPIAPVSAAPDIAAPNQSPRDGGTVGGAPHLPALRRCACRPPPAPDRRGLSRLQQLSPLPAHAAPAFVAPVRGKPGLTLRASPVWTTVGDVASGVAPPAAPPGRPVAPHRWPHRLANAGAVPAAAAASRPFRVFRAPDTSSPKCTNCATMPAPTTARCIPHD